MREAALVPARCKPGFARVDPNLKQRRVDVFQIELGMDDAGSGAHDLYVARDRAAFVAQTVGMGDGAGADIGDDFNIVYN